MSIQKQEFYEGAALYALIRSRSRSIRYENPFFVVDEKYCLILKYSTRKRSPWGFTFTVDEQNIYKQKVNNKLIIGLICGSDGVAGFNYNEFSKIALPSKMAIHISCFRNRREQYRISGPDGEMDGKIARSDWLSTLWD